jgi:hypothetical protein
VLAINQKFIRSFILAVAAHLAKYKFTLKTSPPSPFKPGDEANVPEELFFQPIQGSVSKEWETGVIYADAQNLARTVLIVSLWQDGMPTEPFF